MHIHPIRAGLAVAGLFGAWHLLWSAAVGLGAAQALLDFVLWAHFLKLEISIAPFDLRIAAALVLATSLIGFGFGAVFAVIWNGLHHQSEQPRRSATAR